MRGRTLGRQQAKKRPTDLQERDFTVLRMLKKARLLTTGDFVPLVFPSLPVARRRLLKLVGSGYVAAYTEALHEETRYVLDRRGMVALQELGEFEGQPRSAPKNLPSRGEHHLLLVRFWSRVVAECHSSEDLVLHRFAFEWELHDEHLPTTTRFRPDALLIVEDDEDERVYLVEVDTGTESTSVVRAKFDLFARLQATGMPIYGEMPRGMLILTTTQRRLNALSRASGDEAALFGRVMELREEGRVLSLGWCRLRDLRSGGEVTTGSVVRRRGVE
jgi:hypothetical protein